MTRRDARIRAFLGAAGWAAARAVPLAGDASNRRYLRLTRDGPQDTVVLMDAPPDRGEDVRPFVTIARHLRGLGLGAPAILAADETAGLLLLEDLGDDLFARVLTRQPALETCLYSCATDLLAALHRHPPPTGLAPYSPALMSDLAALAFDWYAAGADDARQAFATRMEAVLAQHAGAAPVLVQRDYHAENLLWLPERAGLARVGLLDFQDAMAGHPAYDLVSLLQDARRDVPPAIEAAMTARYVTATDADPAAFATAYRVLGAQRNLRILGVFARLCRRDGKAQYIDLIPRVWAHLARDLADPALAGIAALVRAHMPAPDAELLRRLKSTCATAPDP